LLLFLFFSGGVPVQFGHLQAVPLHAIQRRLNVLYQFSDVLYSCWRLLPLSTQGSSWHSSLPYSWLCAAELRRLIAPRVYTLPLVRCVSRTMVQGRNYGPQVTVRRLMRPGVRPIFVQVAKQVVKMRPADLRLPSRAWKVKLVGEGADDAGGVFDDTITEMCEELLNGSVPLLIPTPNSINKDGYNQDRFILNPSLTHSTHLLWFKFLGILLGVAMRTKKPLALPLSPLVWKLLIQEPVNIVDLEENDCIYARSLIGVRDIHLSGVTEANFHEMIPQECFEGASWTGALVPIVPGGRSIPLAFHNRAQYVAEAVNFRLHEMDLQVAAVREGMSCLVPVLGRCCRCVTAAYIEQLRGVRLPTRICIGHLRRHRLLPRPPRRECAALAVRRALRIVRFLGSERVLFIAICSYRTIQGCLANLAGLRRAVVGLDEIYDIF
ncbi:hypothetical protein LSTR_LSTR017165, partial [Laodelphax striatellus]